MQCKSAIWVDKQAQNVPCGQCMPCRINRGRIWSARIIMEWLECDHVPYFLTFTYADAHIPHPEIHGVREGRDRIFGSLEKKSFRLWTRDVQTNYAGPFRYYTVGEYGDRRGRAHYHMVVFPVHPAQISAIRMHWARGDVQAGPLTHARARYLANYASKKLTKSSDDRLETGQEPEFRTSSRTPPLGAGFVERLTAFWLQPQRQKLLKKRGDVERAFRWDGKIYPIGGWPLQKLRTNLGIPLAHRDRIKANPDYLKYHQSEDAEWNPEEAEAQELYINAKTISKRYRGTHETL